MPKPGQEILVDSSAFNNPLTIVDLLEGLAETSVEDRGYLLSSIGMMLGDLDPDSEEHIKLQRQFDLIASTFES